MSQEQVWICANCGATHDANDPPCRKCAGERFARVADPEVSPVDATTDVVFRCTQCGRDHNRNNPPCNRCGGMNFETIRDPESVDDNEPATDPTDGRITGPTVVAYLGGIVAFLSLVISLYNLLVWPSILLAACAVVTTPATRRQLEGATGREWTFVAVLVLSVVTFWLGWLWMLISA